RGARRSRALQARPVVRGPRATAGALLRRRPPQRALRVDADADGLHERGLDGRGLDRLDGARVPGRDVKRRIIASRIAPGRSAPPARRARPLPSGRTRRERARAGSADTARPLVARTRSALRKSRGRGRSATPGTAPDARPPPGSAVATPRRS